MELNIRMEKNEDGSATLTVTGPEEGVILALASVLAGVSDDPEGVIDSLEPQDEDVVG